MRLLAAFGVLCNTWTKLCRIFWCSGVVSLMPRLLACWLLLQLLLLLLRMALVMLFSIACHGSPSFASQHLLSR
jgi:hypothetical protein